VRALSMYRSKLFAEGTCFIDLQKTRNVKIDVLQLIYCREGYFKSGITRTCNCRKM